MHLVARAPAQRSLDDLGAPLAEVTFVVVDLETTGGSAAAHAITEIGAVKLRGGECLGTFQTLVNPGVAIPPEIVYLTGITQAMVAPAPRIDSVLPAFLEFLGDAVVVGHNVRFDLAFLQAALRGLGYARLANRFVDTCLLARRLVRDEVANCRLSTLADHFRVGHRPTHRALDDALATGEVLHCLLERAGSLGVLALEDLLELPTVQGHPQLAKLKMASALPRAPGVYIFRDAGGRPLYVGKAVDLRRRVRSYFTGDGRRKVGQLLRETAAIDHVVCAGDLEASVLEVRLIHQWTPRFNRQAKHWRKYAYLKLTLDEPFPRLSVVRAPREGDGCLYLGPLASAGQARLVAEAIETAVPLRRCTKKVPRRVLRAVAGAGTGARAGTVASNDEPGRGETGGGGLAEAGTGSSRDVASRREAGRHAGDEAGTAAFAVGNSSGAGLVAGGPGAPGWRSGPCAPAQLGVSTCPCSGDIGEVGYKAIVDQVIVGLTSEPGLLLGPIEHKMRSLAAAARYEEAAVMRDRADALARALARQRRLDALRRAGRVLVEVIGEGGAVLDAGRLVAAWPAGGQVPLAAADVGEHEIDGEVDRPAANTASAVRPIGAEGAEGGPGDGGRRTVPVAQTTGRRGLADGSRGSAAGLAGDRGASDSHVGVAGAPGGDGLAGDDGAGVSRPGGASDSHVGVAGAPGGDGLAGNGGAGVSGGVGMGRSQDGDSDVTASAGLARPLARELADEVSTVAAWLDTKAARIRLVRCDGELCSPLPRLPRYEPRKSSA